MTDATRQEAIQWAIDNKCDFQTSVWPSPNGWLWAQFNGGLVLSPIFTMTDQGEDLGLQEVLEAQRHE